MSHYAEYKSKNLQDIAGIARAFPFALICKNSEGAAPDIISAPVLIRPDGASAEFHIARNNEAAANFMKGGSVRIIFRGPAAHISPTWYQERWKSGSDPSKTAPTYNYVEARVTGALKTMDDAALKTHLQKLVSHFEGDQGWRFEEINEEFYKKLSAMIVSFTLDIEEAEAIFKLSQEQTPGDHPYITRGLQERDRAGDEALAAMMEKYRAP
ncbi:MAG: FMN-binding negative transcriptional regulator [Alphaproteobacteria bacterium]